MEHELMARPFRREDFSEYRNWYADAELNARLGPMDDDWLTHVLAQRNGCTYGFFDGEELVAVVSVLFPDPDHSAYYVTDFAIKPTLRSRGIGSAALMLLMQNHPLQPGESWRAFIDIRNPRARAFFKHNGWACLSEKPDASGMWEMDFGPRNTNKRNDATLIP